MVFPFRGMQPARYRRRCAILTFLLAPSGLVFVAEAGEQSTCNQQLSSRDLECEHMTEAKVALEQQDVERSFPKKLMQKAAALKDVELEDEESVQSGNFVSSPVAVSQLPTDLSSRGHISDRSSGQRSSSTSSSSHSSHSSSRRCNNSSSVGCKAWVCFESLGQLILDPLHRARQQAVGHTQTLAVEFQKLATRGRNLIRIWTAKAVLISANVAGRSSTIALGILIPLVVVFIGILAYCANKNNDESPRNCQPSRQHMQHMLVQKSAGGTQALPTRESSRIPGATPNLSSTFPHQLKHNQQQHTQFPALAAPVDTAVASAAAHRATPLTGNIRSAVSIAASSMGSGQLAGQTMCPELCIPDGKECNLLLAEMGEGGSSFQGVLPIYDVGGTVVLYCAYTLAEFPPHGSYDLPGNGKRLVLRNAKDEHLLASSCDIIEPDSGSNRSCGPLGMALLDADEEQHAILRANGGGGTRSGYTLTNRTGRKLLVRKDTSARFCITDEDGWLLAATGLDAPSEADARGRRRLRISPGADAAIIILSLLGAEALAVHSDKLDRLHHVAGIH
mmetsp:Transcript_13129/g.25751  ORF Transcript_13129/g.25751 Transcript_13129/m.25751 type:complete len:563 (-) Transcript_13129:59-1747(-)